MATSLSSDFPKMEIRSYDLDEIKNEESDIKTLKVGINPNSYKHSYKSVEKDIKPKVDNTPVTHKIVKLREVLTFTLTLDSTGVVPNTQEVEDDINWIKTNIAQYDPSLHSTRYVDINWGMLKFVRSQLSSCNFNCTYFNRSGVPLRATVELTFERIIDSKIIEKQSPDLTHMRTVKAGDTLPLMCNDIYKDPSYYLKVAEVNGLANFMNLQPGQRIYFPPLKPTQ